MARGRDAVEKILDEMLSGKCDSFACESFPALLRNSAWRKELSNLRKRIGSFKKNCRFIDSRQSELARSQRCEFFA